MISNDKKILTFGFGNMAQALLSCAENEIDAVVENRQKSREKNPKINYLFKENSSYQEIFNQEQSLVLLALKPQKLHEIVDDLRKLKLTSQAAIISILAGISTSILQNIFGEKAAILRAMPNMPIAINQGVVTIYFANSLTKKKQQDLKYLAYQYFASSNKNSGNKLIFVDDEKKINYATSLSGSGSAYFFLIAEMIANFNKNFSEKKVFEIIKKSFDEVDLEFYTPKNKWRQSLADMLLQASLTQENIADFILSFTQTLFYKAREFQFSKEEALILARQTAIGAAEYGIKSTKNAKTLKESITSEGGTTAAALKVFNEIGCNSLSALVDNAIQAAIARACELEELTLKKFKNELSTK